MDGAASNQGRRAAELAARHSYGRLLAHLARAWRDVAAAEDALADAFANALETWPRTGVPHNPDGWLMVAARNRLRDVARRHKVQTDAANTLTTLASGAAEETPMLADRRLELMFVCAHPAIDIGARTPLMLQTVLGLTAERIRRHFLSRPIP